MYKLITHTDLDGVSCAVLARLAWGDNVDISFCQNPVAVAKTLYKLYQKGAWKQYNLIFITDLSFDIAILDTIPKFKNIIRLFDHHNSAVEPFSQYSWATVTEEYNGHLTCGTELFYHYLLNRNLIGNRDYYVEQVRLYDTWDWFFGNSKIPYFLSNIVFKIGLQYFFRIFSERLKNNDVNELNIFNQYERDILLVEDEREQKDVEMFLKQTYICEVENKTIHPTQTIFKVGIVFNSSMYSSLLGNEMCRLLNVDIAFMVNLNTSRVEVRTKRDDIDLSVIMALYYRGGGHLKSAGGVLSITPDVIKLCLSNLGMIHSIERQK